MKQVICITVPSDMSDEQVSYIAEHEKQRLGLTDDECIISVNYINY